MIPLRSFDIRSFSDNPLNNRNISIKSTEQSQKNIPAITIVMKKPSLKTGTKLSGW